MIYSSFGLQPTRPKANLILALTLYLILYPNPNPNSNPISNPNGSSWGRVTAAHFSNQPTYTLTTKRNRVDNLSPCECERRRCMR